MVIKIKNHIQHCYSNNDGQAINDIILPILTNNNTITISFEGIDSVTSSFINAAFIPLLETFDFDFIRKRLNFINSSKQINDMIKGRFDFEVNKRKDLLLV